MSRDYLILVAGKARNNVKHLTTEVVEVGNVCVEQKTLARREND